MSMPVYPGSQPNPMVPLLYSILNKGKDPETMALEHAINQDTKTTGLKYMDESAEKKQKHQDSGKCRKITAIISESGNIIGYDEDESKPCGTCAALDRTLAFAEKMGS